MPDELPAVVLLAAEFGDQWLWEEAADGVWPLEDPLWLGLSPALVARLSAWNGEFEDRGARWGYADPPLEHWAADRAAVSAWSYAGLLLARELQAEFDAAGRAVSVRYFHEELGRAVTVRNAHDGRDWEFRGWRRR